MNEGDAIFYPRVSWAEKSVSSERLNSKEDLEIGIIIKRLAPDKSGEVVYQVLKKDGTLHLYFDFELKAVEEEQ